MKKTLIIFFIFFQSKANALNFDGKFIQGNFIIGKTEPNSKIWIDKKKNKSNRRWLFCFWNWA